MKNPRLTKAALKWRDQILKEFEIDDPGGLLLLEAAMQAFDRAQEARAILDRDGITFADRFGQPRPHPAAAIERDNRAAMVAALKALNLDLEPLRDRPGRPPGPRPASERKKKHAD